MESTRERRLAKNNAKLDRMSESRIDDLEKGIKALEEFEYNDDGYEGGDASRAKESFKEASLNELDEILAEAERQQALAKRRARD